MLINLKRSEAPAFLVIVRKTRRKPVEAAPVRFEGDTGNPALRSHHLVSIEARARSSTGHATIMGARVKDQTPMDRYYLRQQLGADPHKNYVYYQAGQRLRSDFYYSGLQLHTLSTFEPRVSSGKDHSANIKADAVKRYKNAMKEIPQGLKAILVHVCCLEGTAQDWAMRNGQSKDAGITVLRLALEELAGYYGLIKSNS